ncbi:MAG: tagaturonate reductase, partial [Ferruginibacter sp.]|nr:tagaturonate reductase [Ferruginibacter sp.]
LRSLSPNARLVLPAENVFDLPEKVLQFGTGVLLRGLPDFLINKANNENVSNGRIVIVKSTSGGGDATAFNEQDGLYTVCVRGVEETKKIEEYYISAAVSRVLTAATDWDDILLCAENPFMEVVISNTTEVGITLVKDNIHASPPISFPGKLLAFLYHRFKFFNKDPEKGMVIIPTELVPANGEKLISIVLEIAHQNGLESDFIDWLEISNHFCNSLVDRIVPGKLDEAEQQAVEKMLGYKDRLMIMSEVYALWAIESSSEKVKKVLSFAAVHDGIIIAKNIDKFRELKLRLLNGSHSFACGVAFLAGFETVKQAMENKYFAEYIQKLMYAEIIPSILSDDIDADEAKAFADKVLDRYRNEYLDHKWINITAQFSSKMHLRNTGVIKEYYNRFNQVPALMALGMAAHILFMRTEKNDDGQYYGITAGKKYLVTDANAGLYCAKWKKYRTDFIVSKIFENLELWQTDLNLLPGFAEEVTEQLILLKSKGAMETLKFASQEINSVKNDN